MKIDERTSIVFTNLEELQGLLKGASDQMREAKEKGHFLSLGLVVEVTYQLIIDGKTYDGKSIFHHYKGITHTIAADSPMAVEVKNWKLGDDNPNPVIEFELVEK